jgi:hypothetical protein
MATPYNQFYYGDEMLIKDRIIVKAMLLMFLRRVEQGEVVDWRVIKKVINKEVRARRLGKNIYPCACTQGSCFICRRVANEAKNAL